MITHITAKLAVSKLKRLKVDWVDKRVDIVTSYIVQQETLQAEFESLKKDLNRFLELDTMLYLQGYHSKEETIEYQELRTKLTKESSV